MQGKAALVRLSRLRCLSWQRRPSHAKALHLSFRQCPPYLPCECFVAAAASLTAVPVQLLRCLRQQHLHLHQLQRRLLHPLLQLQMVVVVADPASGFQPSLV